MIASGAFLYITILNIVVIGSQNLYFHNHFLFVFYLIAFTGPYLSSISGIASYFPDRYVNALIIGTVSVILHLITYKRLKKSFFLFSLFNI